MSVDVTKYLGTIRKTVDHYAQYAPWWMRLELRQMVTVILLEYDPAKLADAESKHLVPALISRIVRNQWCSTNSEFHRRWRRGLDVDDFYWESMEEEEKEDIEDDEVWLIKQLVEELPEEVKETFKLYVEYGDYVHPAEIQGIYPSSVVLRLRKARKIIRQGLEVYRRKNGR